MRRRKSKKAAARKIASLLIEHREETMSPAQDKATMADLKAFAQKPRRSSPR
jgi:hypothetical protein